jgi:hypothetical protein
MQIHGFGLVVAWISLAGVAAAVEATPATASPEPTGLGRPVAAAAPQREQEVPEPSPKAAAANEVQRLSFVENAYGTSKGKLFAGVSSLAISSSDERAQVGLLFGGSPLKNLTLHGLVGRDGKGHFAPLLAAQYTILGGSAQRYALGALAQYKTEGFTEAGGEAELGALFSLRPGLFLFDLATIVGIGLEEEEGEAGKEEEEGEADAEGKLRFAYQVFEPLRIGAVGRLRKRLVGERSLAGGKTWDFIGGGEVVASFGPCAVSASGGPTTVGVADGVGAYGMLSVALFSAL